MRINQIKEDLKSQIKDLEINVSKTDILLIENWGNIYRTLQKLREYSFVKEVIDQTFKKVEVDFLAERVKLQSQTYVIRFKEDIKLIKEKCLSIIDFEFPFVEDSEKNIYVKLPVDLNSIGELKNIINKLDSVFSDSPLFSKKFNKIEFKGVERGTDWIVIACCALTGFKALNYIAEYFKTCTEINLNLKQARQLDLENIVLKSSIEEKEKEKISQALEQSRQEIEKEKITEQISKICEKYNIDLTPEEQGRAINSTQNLIKLFSAGVEIYPSDKITNEEKLLFPKKEEYKQIQTIDIKLIADKSNEKDLK